MPKITGSHLLVKSLYAEGIKTVFGVAGDHILHLLDTMADEPFQMVDTRHESAAVHAADAYARTLRRPSVALSTTPGHANALPALANAAHSEAPVVNIAGSAESLNLGRGAMQEFDQVGAAAPLCKGAWMVPSVERIPEYVALAFRTATSGRRGPVHLTIPHDLQSAEVDASAFERYAPAEYGKPMATFGNHAQIKEALRILNSAKRPMVIAGESAAASANCAELLELVETIRCPFLAMDSARALIPDSHELSIGFAFPPLNKAAQRIKEADVVLMLGKRLDFIMNYGASPLFADDVKLILVDPSPAEIGRARTVEVGICGDVGNVIFQLSEEAKTIAWHKNEEWRASLKKTHREWLAELEELATEEAPIHPMLVSSVLREFIDDDTHITFDGGDYCHFIRASVPREKPFRFQNVSSFGMIGVGIAYAIGAQVALPSSVTVLAVGDGSFGFNGIELDTMVRHNLPIKVFLGNNSTWGIDWHIQQGLYGRQVWTDLLPTRWDKVAEGLGALGRYVTNPTDLRPAVKEAFGHPGPALVNIDVSHEMSPVAESVIKRSLTGRTNR